jgi:NAD(P)H-dependent flavin oxidoreductase YrpB (nitropropane dioxygenase family)
MKFPITERLGIEYPIFAFSHCRDVVAAVSRAGGFGVLGGASFSTDQLEMELDWLDEHCGGTPYGLDLLIPAKTATGGMASAASSDHSKELYAMLPLEHRVFTRRILEENGIPTRPLDAPPPANAAMADNVEIANNTDRVLASLRRPAMKMFVSALGPPSPEILDGCHEHDVVVGALVGTPAQAERQVQRGVDVIVAQGTEAGGHTNEISTMVLVPDVVDAVGPDVPVLAAGGIGTGRQIAASLALGAQGVWMGSIWLTTTEAETTPDAMEAMFQATSTDTVRSRSSSGKPIRQIRSTWTEAWARPDAPKTLDMPLQGLLLQEALGSEFAGRRGFSLAKPIVGQIVSRMNERRTTRVVMQDLVEELVATLERQAGLLVDA